MTAALQNAPKELYLSPEELLAAKARLAHLPSWDLTPRQLCDLELLLNGGFAPLEGFLNRDDYESVRDNLRLANGQVWPIPITLDLPEEVAADLQRADELVLRDPEGLPLAILEVGDVWRPDRVEEAQKVFGSDDTTHSGVNDLLNHSHDYYVGGRILGLHAPVHHDFRNLRLTPRQLRTWLAEQGWSKIVAFQTRNPMHRAHLELTLRAAQQEGAKLLLHPVVGRTKPGDIDHYTRVRCYQALIPHYPAGDATLSLLPLAMRMAGPREALWHALIRKNYGATHLIVGRDHAGPGNDKSGKPFYGPYDAQDLLRQYQSEIGIEVVTFPEMVYAENRDAYIPVTEITEADHIKNISGTELRRRLQTGEDIPAWFSFPQVIRILRERHPVDRRGFTLFFTGLSGAGKSTVANAVISRLHEKSARPITLLDGDLVRKHLSRGLGFSKEDRHANVERIGFVAAEITRHGGIAVCAPIAPYAESRQTARRLIEAHGTFIEIHVSTSLEVCETRDRKGLYAKARAGLLPQFTGISDPYEVPENPEIALDTAKLSVEEAVDSVLAALEARGLI